jgi:hypothetical protein
VENGDRCSRIDRPNEEEHKLVWQLEVSRKFSTKSLYTVVTNSEVT